MSLRKIALICFVAVFSISSCKKESLTVDPGVIEADHEKSEHLVDIKSSGSWNIVYNNAKWIKITPVRASGSKEVLIVVEENKSDAAREALVKFELVDGDISCVLKIVQRGAPVIENLYKNDEWILVSKGKNAKSPKIVFMGDGYIKEDFVHGGNFDKDIDIAIETFFLIEPFKSLKEYFSIYKYVKYSSESGISEPHKGINKKTAFNVYFNDDHTTEIGNIDEVFRCVERISDISAADYKDVTVNITANIDRYGGRCFIHYDDPNVGISAKDKNYYSYLVIHESGGHGFGLLADEYQDNGKKTITEEELEYLDYYKTKHGIFRNVSATDDPEKVPWSPILGKSGYESTGIFEGAYYCDFGIWRSTEASVMRGWELEFNPFCRYLIYERTMTLSGESYSWEDFFNLDKINLTKSSSSVPLIKIPTDRPPLAPPVLPAP